VFSVGQCHSTSFRFCRYGLFLEEITVYQEYQTDNRYLDSGISQSHEQSRTRATFAIGELREFTKYIQFELRLDGSMGI
jgi:hypothetical protein